MIENISRSVKAASTAGIDERLAAPTSLRSQRIYKVVSLFLSILFAIVGLIFLLAPDSVILTMNGISRTLSMRETSVQGFSFFLVLAVAYMYLVALLAYMMFLHPDNTFFPWMLTNAKAATAILSICLIVLHGAYLIYFINGIVDGAIALGVLMLSRKGVRSA